VTADLACAIADGGEVISGFRVLTDQKELFGLVASVPTTWRTLDEIGAGGPRTLTRITRAVNAARRQAWAAIEARHGALPGVRIADKVMQGVTCIRLDATVTPAHSDKEFAEPNFKGMGYPLNRSNADQRRARVSWADGLFRSVTSANVGRRGGALRLNG
jgi:hypothetical protein